jgi:hypothetical protein
MSLCDNDATSKAFYTDNIHSSEGGGDIGNAVSLDTLVKGDR